MATKRANKRSITVTTTTWSVRWWDGTRWIEHTLEPKVVVQVGTDQPNQSDVPTPEPANVPQESVGTSKPDQPTKEKPA